LPSPLRARKHQPESEVRRMDDFTLHDALQIAVMTEQLGAKVYTRFAKRFADDKGIAEVFTKLAGEEQFHERYFQSLLDQNPRTEKEVGRFGVDEYLRATAISEFFGKDAMNKLKEVATPGEALAQAVRLEKATLLFYHALRDNLGASTALDELINAEKSHLTTLMKVVLTDARFRGLSDTW
jgi:rubrerythrin